MTKRQLVGLTGLARSGKTVVLDRLHSVHGFSAISASGIINAEANRQSNTTLSREELRALGRRIRLSEGADFVVQRALQLDNDRIAIDGLRNLSAARTFTRLGGILIGLVARPEVRFQRATDIALPDKRVPASVAEMLAEELPELNSLDPYGMHILPILWEMNPENIIDTSDLEKEEVIDRVERILALP